MSAPLLLDRIAEVRARSRGVDVAVAALTCVLGLVSVLAAFLLLDWWVVADFESVAADRIGRVVLLLIAVAALAECVRRTLWRALRRHEDDDVVAMRIERGSPAVRGRLVATIQLTRERPLGASRDLIAALEEETLEVAEDVRFTDVVALEPLKRAALIALAALVFAGAFTAWKPGHVKALLLRLALLNASYPTATRLVALTPGTRVPRGEPFVVDLAVDPAGAVPEEGMLEFAALAGGPTTRLTLKRVEDAGGRPHFRATVPRVLEDARYRALAGDARWPTWETLTALERPAVRELALTYKPPAYLGEPESTSTVGDVRAVMGTIVRVHATLNQAVTEAVVRVRIGDERSELPMTLAADGTSADVDLPIKASGTWRIGLKAADGLTDSDPVDHAIIALKDRAPTVRVVSPAEDKTVTDIARPRIVFTARDDHAVAKLALRWRVERGDDVGADDDADAMARSSPIDLPPGKREIQGETILDLRVLGVAAGSKLTWWLDAADGCDPPNVASSAKYRFTVVDVRTMQQQLEAQRRELLKELDRVRTEQKKAYGEVQGLQQRLRTGGQGNP